MGELREEFVGRDNEFKGSQQTFREYLLGVGNESQ